MSHFPLNGQSHFLSGSTSDFFLNISCTGEAPKFPGQDPRKRPAVPPAWNAGPGVKPPGDPLPGAAGTIPHLFLNPFNIF